jgi:outer membrane immunogenic protein
MRAYIGAIASGLALILSVVTANADGYSIKDSPRRAIAHTWTGLHVGANVGGLFEGEADTTALSVFNNAPFEFNNLSAFAGGVQIGYDIQTHNWVVGVEADFQWLDLEEQAAPSATPQDTADGKLNWFGTVRGRLGYSYGDWMPYITGGLLYGEFEAKYNLPGVFGLQPSWQKETNVGWTIGGGVEIALHEGWSLRGEYLYLRFPERDISIPNTLGGTYEFDFEAHYARASLNYRF